MTHHEGQGDGQAEPVVEAQLCEIRSKPRLWGGDPKVRGQREPESATDRRTLYGRDYGQSLLEQAAGHVVEIVVSLKLGSAA